MTTQPDTGNEFIYGSGSIVSTQRRGHYFWMRRYLAQLLVRPIPSAVWPTKYEDFGVPELRNNAGTAEGFADALGWVEQSDQRPALLRTYGLSCLGSQLPQWPVWGGVTAGCGAKL